MMVEGRHCLLEVPYSLIPLVLGCGDLKFWDPSGVGSEDKGKNYVLHGSWRLQVQPPYTFYPDLIPGSFRFATVFVVFPISHTVGELRKVGSALLSLSHFIMWSR